MSERPSPATLQGIDRLAEEAGIVAAALPLAAGGADVVRPLHEMLRRAELGEFTAVAVCAVRADGTVSSTYYRGEAWAALLGASTLLTRRIMEEG